ncbi:MAG: hypothetical protein UY49_C0020G0011 [Microgenomates group bacterium GW2011_GWC1_49_7]|nr:MAG: hypothetical protein UY49_C0020G0011 [Microgenomates group bacterium GW2011_GWC1_49_7]
MTRINLTKLLQKYKSGWVALSSDYSRVVGHAEKFIDLQKKVKDKKNIVVIQAFDNYYNYVS